MITAYYVVCCETGDCYNQGQWCEEPEFFPTIQEAVRATETVLRTYPHPTQVHSAELDDDEAN